MKTEVLPAFAGEHELNTEAIEKAGGTAEIVK